MSRRNPQFFEESEDEAVESREHVQQDEGLPQSEQEGQDLLEEPERDYQRNDVLDRYQEESVDAQQIELNPEARRRAEMELDMRAQKNRQAELDDFYDDDDEEAELRKRRQFYWKEEAYDDDDIEDQRYIDPEESRGQLHKWIAEEQTKKYIKRKFQRFLREFYIVPDDQPEKKIRIYFPKLMQMLHENKPSIDISYQHLKTANPTLAMWLGLEPIYLIPELNAILYNTLCKISPQFKNIIKETYVKFYELPLLDKIPMLKVEHLTKLVKVKGAVTARSEVFSQLKKAMYKCFRCGEQKGPYFLHERETINHGACRACQASGPYLLEKLKSVYRNYQKLTVQQSPSQVLPGRIPRTKEVIVVGDNVDITKPGEQIEIIGIYTNRYQISTNFQTGFPVFHTFIEANSIKKINDTSMFSKVEEAQFVKMAKRPDIAEIIYNSIAPTIYGHYESKQAIAFSLFGGNQKIIEAKAHRIRGDINVLLLGDPGTAKSQFLKSVQKIAPRSVYATGKGASAVGLTATVKQDNQTGQWRLQAGAMVLADKGLCLIDQFDKMNEHDRTSIHEAMEQQTISISKAGIVAQLRARCSVIAAANPVQGQYNQTLNFMDNVNLSEPILSRFDIVKVIRDKPNESMDYDLSSFVINSHMKHHPYNQQFQQTVKELTGKQKPKEVMDQDFFKQYIRFAKERVKKPALTEKCSDMIKDFYKTLREKSAISGGLSITSRHLQSTIRVCEAHAKMHLRQETIRLDAEVAIRAMLRSFIETQKYSTAKKIEKQTKFYLQ